MKRFLLTAILCLATVFCTATSVRKREQLSKETFSAAQSIEKETDLGRLIKEPRKRRTKGKRSNFSSISDLTERVDRHRKLKKGHDRYGGYYPTYRNEEISNDDYQYTKEKGKRKKKGKYGRGKKNGQKSRSTCRKVVEPIEFFIDPPVETVLNVGSQSLVLTTTVGGGNGTTGNELINSEIEFDEFNNTNANTDDNMDNNRTSFEALEVLGSINNTTSNINVSFSAGDAQELGTKFVFNGPLLTLDDDDGVATLPDFFISGVCTRTWMSIAGVPGASHCNLALSVDTGDSIIIEGEVFDGWDSNLSVEGGTLELMGSDGQITITPVDEMFVPLDIGSDVFLDSAYLRGRGTIIYNICEEGFWDQAEKNFENLDSGIGGSYPDPFELERDEE